MKVTAPPQMQSRYWIEKVMIRKVNQRPKCCLQCQVSVMGQQLSPFLRVAETSKAVNPFTKFTSSFLSNGILLRKNVLSCPWLWTWYSLNNYKELWTKLRESLKYVKESLFEKANLLIAINNAWFKILIPKYCLRSRFVQSKFLIIPLSYS